MKHGTRSGYSYHRCRCELCKEAKQEADRKYRDNQHIPQPGVLYWPLEPLFEAAGTTLYVELAVRTDVPARTLHRASVRGLTDRIADRAATRLGLHPSMIWPNWIDPYLEGAA
jgi:hypothetical protein